MEHIKRFLLYLFVYIAVFTASGEAYLYYLDSALNDCDYYFECEIESAELRREYAQELAVLGPQLDLVIYAIDYKPVSSHHSRYTIYTINEKTEEIVRDKFLVKDKNEFLSIFSGRREVIFRDISELEKEPGVSLYNVIGSGENAEKFRSLTVDKYGTGKPYDGGYSGDHTLILVTAWGLASILFIFIAIAKGMSIRRELCVRYINGYSKRKLDLKVILDNSCLLSVAASAGVLIAGCLTEAAAFGTALLCGVAGQILLSSLCLLWKLRITDIRKIFTQLVYGRVQRCGSMLLLAATLSLYIAAFSLCLQNAVNAGRTISQQDFWQSYEDYESVLFFSREETDDANRELDNKYAAEFYQKYVDRYDISLAFKKIIAYTGR